MTDPVRRAIVAHIAADPGESCSNADLGVSKSALTQHWRVLLESGPIRQEADGVRHRNWLRTEELDSRFPGLAPLVLRELSAPADTTPRRDTLRIRTVDRLR